MVDDIYQERKVSKTELLLFRSWQVAVMKKVRTYLGGN